MRPPFFWAGWGRSAFWKPPNRATFLVAMKLLPGLIRVMVGGLSCVQAGKIVSECGAPL